MVGCPWCLGEGKCRAGKEETCDFKNLPMQMIAITERVDVEFQAVNDLMNEMKKEEDEKKLFELMRLIADKMSGIGIMREVLMNKFNKNYFPASKFEFLKLVYEVHTKMRKFGGAKDGRDRPKRGDEMAGQTHS